MAQSTSFSLDVSEFSFINDHINSELRVAASTPQVSFLFAKLLYPDASVQFIEDVSSFSVPIYEAEGVASFNVALLLVVKVNGEEKEGPLTSISLT